MNNLIPLYVILPLGAAFLIPVLGRFIRSLNVLISSIVFLVLAVMSIILFINYAGQTLTYTVGGWEPAGGIPVGISMILDPLSLIILLTISFITLMANLFASQYLAAYTARDNYYTLLCLMIAGMNGVVLAGDLFNLYVFLEIASIASYALVAYGVEKVQLEASFKYQVLGGVASMLILFSIGLLYWTTSTLNLADMGALMSGKGHESIFIFIQVLLLAGFGLKAAVVPFHAWLPDAHSSAPSPISSLLSGVLIKAIGVYALVRLFFNVFEVSYGIAYAVTILGTISVIAGGLLAIGQDDYKRLLAYSSISQVGYIIVGLGTGLLVISLGGDHAIASLAVFGALFHLVNHAVFKSLLFMTAGAVEYATGLRDLRKLGGLSGSMPVTSATSFSGSMAISGMPPFSGFFSKLIIIIAAIQAGFYWVGIVLALMSIITLAYFLKLQKDTFLSKGRSALANVKEVPWMMQTPMIILGILCVALSMLMIPGIREQVLSPAVDTLVETVSYSLNLMGNPQ